MEALRLNNPFMFSQEQSEFLDKAAKRYIWWMTKEEAMLDPFFVISQVMNLGDINDSAKLFCIFDHKILRNLLFSEHVFVTPAMPVRKIPDWDSL